MEKKKTLETIGEIVITIVSFSVGALIVVTCATLMYSMFMSLFD
jgi:hypothetical protein